MTRMRAKVVVAVFVFVWVLLTGSLVAAQTKSDDTGSLPFRLPKTPNRLAQPTIQDPATGKSYRLDYCFNFGNKCGKEAADAFCKSSDIFPYPYEKATAWLIDPNIGQRAPTWVMGDKRICDKPSCDGFAFIECSD